MLAIAIIFIVCGLGYMLLEYFGVMMSDNPADQEWAAFGSSLLLGLIPVAVGIGLLIWS